MSEKLSKLQNIIKSYESAVIAFSGGVDSSLLAYISHNILAQKSLVITVNSEFIPESEIAEAQNLAEKFGFNYRIINISVINNPVVTENNPRRCKYCKELIFNQLIEIAKNQGYKNIFDGSNIDDTGDYRPGMKALEQLGVKSPVMEAGFGKEDIRSLAKSFNLPNWNKPSSPCLASRIPYNTPITADALKVIEEAEDYIKKLGYNNFRVRHHSNIARIELNPDDIENFTLKHREEVDSKFKELGYNYVCLDLKGYRTGSLNEILNNTGV